MTFNLPGWFFIFLLFFSLFHRRVHITQATLDYLQGEYEVEAGNGASRNQYLRDHCVTTYFIVPPARRRKVFNTACVLYGNVICQGEEKNSVQLFCWDSNFSKELCLVTNINFLVKGTL